MLVDLTGMLAWEATGCCLCLLLQFLFRIKKRKWTTHHAGGHKHLIPNNKQDLPRKGLSFFEYDVTYSFNMTKKKALA